MFYQIFAHMEKHKKVVQKKQKQKKKHKPVTSNPPIRIYVNEIENGTTFKIKTENHLEPLMPQTVKALGSTGGKISKYENGENVPHLQII